ncbi:hypothetical protein [Desulfurococcus amylolyticus]|uniref:Uncharacterized protein n=1 Tax=Desulfurococcus amylolyticus DSM 16532 TaxID=768672 RepID=I3XT32_DESAM|nr:hypothetical protein [Desulfurococcus amylolyticus]AFL67106.1 hypothetical protein Desfe_1236 [Desulfurococcus amylolyticus DSM 16532]
MIIHLAVVLVSKTYDGPWKKAIGTSINLDSIGSLLDIYGAENAYTHLTLALITLSIVDCGYKYSFLEDAVFKKASRRFTTVYKPVSSKC